jgi:hypothetical protein
MGSDGKMPEAQCVCFSSDCKGITDEMRKMPLLAAFGCQDNA